MALTYNELNELPLPLCSSRTFSVTDSVLSDSAGSSDKSLLTNSSSRKSLITRGPLCAVVEEASMRQRKDCKAIVRLLPCRALEFEQLNSRASVVFWIEVLIVGATYLR